MDRILVLGSSGSGKSTFARLLGNILGLEVIHLDSYYWKPNWQATPVEEWESILKELLLRPRWVMDGNYPATLDQRLEFADTVVFIDLNRLLCLWRCVKRYLTYRGENRPELAPGCYEKIDLDFFMWIWNYPQTVKPIIMETLERNISDLTVTILDDDRSVNSYLTRIASERG